MYNNFSDVRSFCVGLFHLRKKMIIAACSSCLALDMSPYKNVAMH